MTCVNANRQSASRQCSERMSIKKLFSCNECLPLRQGVRFGLPLGAAGVHPDWLESKIFATNTFRCVTLAGKAQSAPGRQKIPKIKNLATNAFRDVKIYTSEKRRFNSLCRLTAVWRNIMSLTTPQTHIFRVIPGEIGAIASASPFSPPDRG